MHESGKRLLTGIPKEATLVLILVLSATASFGLGILAGRDSVKGEGSDLWVEQLPVATSTLPAAVSGGLPRSDGQFVASKNGAKYYLPTCSGAARINDANKVWFATKAEAEAHGYTPAANCPGL